MQTVTLQFSGDLRREEIYAALAAAESGIEVDERPPLASELGDTIAIVGVVLNLAQLAAALWQIKQHRQGQAKPEVSVMSEDGVAAVIAEESPQEIEAKLKQVLKD